MGHIEEMNLDDIHRASLETLKKIGEICDKIGVRYFAVFGTLIGAIRHKGFIPWDDDLDIGMFRPDYDKFIEYCMNNKSVIDGYSLDNYKTVKNIPFAISRFCNLNYVYKFDGNSTYTQSGAFVDIYPFDGMGNTLDDIHSWENDLHKRSFYIRMINYAGLKFSQRNSLGTMILSFPLALYAKIITSNRIVPKLEKLGQRYRGEDSKYIGLTIWDLESKVQYWNKELFDKCISVPFEDTHIMIPCGFDEFLRSIYGDYMQLPKPENRITMHGYKAYRHF